MGDPRCRFELTIDSPDRFGLLVVEVVEGEGLRRMSLGRALIPRLIVDTAAEFDYDDGGEGRTVTLKLVPPPMALDKVQGTVTVRVDPLGAPPASGLSEEDAALASLAAFTSSKRTSVTSGTTNAAATKKKSTSGGGGDADGDEAAAIDDAEAAEARALKADEAAEMRAVLAAQREQGELLGAPPPPSKGSLAATPLELKWPMSDFFVADALRDYVSLLEEVNNSLCDCVFLSFLP